MSTGSWSAGDILPLDLFRIRVLISITIGRRGDRCSSVESSCVSDPSSGECSRDFGTSALLLSNILSDESLAAAASESDFSRDKRLRGVSSGETSVSGRPSPEATLAALTSDQATVAVLTSDEATVAALTSDEATVAVLTPDEAAVTALTSDETAMSPDESLSSMVKVCVLWSELFSSTVRSLFVFVLLWLFAFTRFCHLLSTCEMYKLSSLIFFPTFSGGGDKDCAFAIISNTPVCFLRSFLRFASFGDSKLECFACASFLLFDLCPETTDMGDVDDCLDSFFFSALTLTFGARCLPGALRLR